MFSTSGVQLLFHMLMVAERLVTELGRTQNIEDYRVIMNNQLQNTRLAAAPAYHPQIHVMAGNNNLDWTPT